MINKIIAAAGAVFIALGVEGVVRAEILLFREREAFTNVASDLVVEDFEDSNLAEESIITFPGNLDSTTNNLAFSPGSIEGVSFSAIGADANELDLLTQNVLGTSSAVIGPSSFLNDLAIIFDNPVSQAGFDILADLTVGTVEVKVFGDKGLLATQSIVISNSPTFFGIISDTDSITKIVIANENKTEVVSKLIDNVVFSSNSTVPNS